MSIDGPAAIPDSASGRSGITILHVDDDTGLVDLAATVLEQERETFTVLTETTADAALARLDDDIDCVVSDYEMPGRDGLDFLRAVREQYPDLPFILFTGKGSEEIASDAISAGVTDYLQKESGLGQYAVLANRIENAVQKHRAERIVERAYGAMDTAREGIALLDEAGYFQYVNQAYADITGYDRADLIGEHWKLLYPAGRADRVHDEILPAVPDEGRWTGETAYERADGERIRVSHALAYTEDGTLICLVTPVEEGAVLRDDETPATGNDTPPDDSVIAAALDTLDDLFYVLDTDGNIVYVNERGAAITGHTAAEMQSMNAAELFDAADRDRIPQGIRNA
ncbi:MAG: PAS domain S-box protein, partial [Haloplanus sp.]